MNAKQHDEDQLLAMQKQGLADVETMQQWGLCLLKTSR